MNTSELTKFIDALFDLETNREIIISSLENLSFRISKLGIKRNIHKPQYSEPQKQNSPKDKSNKSMAVFVVILVISVLYGIYYAYQEELSTGRTDLLLVGTILRSILWVPVYLIIGLIIGFLVVLIVEAISSASGKMESKKKHQTDIKIEKDRYQQKMVQYEKEVENDSARVHQELQYKRVLQADMQLLSNRLKSIEATLKQLYDTLDILPQYRNIIAVGYMNDLLKIGAATQLKGPDQLYEKVRRDMREDRIPAGLGEISSKLDTIINQNNRLYGTVQAIFKEQATLCDNIEQSSQRMQVHMNVKSNSEAALAYEAKLIKKELQYQSYMLK